MKKLLYILLVFLAVGVWVFFQGPPVKRPAADVAVEALLHHCLGPVLARADPADAAVKKKLPELPPEQAQRFLQEGRVFAVPEARGDVVVQVPVLGCSIAVRKLDTEAFWANIEKNFGSKTVWKEDKETPVPGGKRRDFVAEIDGPVILLVSARDTFQESGLQALMTVARLEGGPEEEDGESATGDEETAGGEQPAGDMAPESDAGTGAEELP